jgi:hypothetical protein
MHVRCMWSHRTVQYCRREARYPRRDRITDLRSSLLEINTFSIHQRRQNEREVLHRSSRSYHHMATMLPYIIQTPRQLLITPAASLWRPACYAVHSIVIRPLRFSIVKCLRVGVAATVHSD